MRNVRSSILRYLLEIPLEILEKNGKKTQEESVSRRLTAFE